MKMHVVLFAIFASAVSAQNINKFVISDEAAKKTPIVMAANFAVGVNAAAPTPRSPNPFSTLASA